MHIDFGDLTSKQIKWCMVHVEVRRTRGFICGGTSSSNNATNNLILLHLHHRKCTDFGDLNYRDNGWPVA